MNELWANATTLDDVCVVDDRIVTIKGEDTLKQATIYSIRALANGHFNTDSLRTTKLLPMLQTTLMPLPPKSSHRPWSFSTSSIIKKSGNHDNIENFVGHNTYMVFFYHPFGWWKFPICKTWLFHSCRLMSSETLPMHQVKVLLTIVIPLVANKDKRPMKTRVEDSQQSL